MQKIKLIQVGIALAVLFLSATDVSAQWYLNLGLGYGYNKDLMNPVNLTGPLSFPGYSGTNTEVYSSVYSNGTNSGTDNLSTSQSLLHGGFGGGLNFGGTIGYSFNEHLSGECGVFYLPGNTYKASIHQSYTDNYNDFYPNDSSYNSSMNNQQYDFTIVSGGRVRLMPAIKISATPATITPYLKLGLVIGLGGSMTITENESDYNSQSSHTVSGGINTNNYDTSYWSYNNYAMTTSGGISLGFTGALGAEYKLSDNMSLFGELAFISEQWAPTTGVVTTYSENGMDRLAGLSTDQKTFAFTNNASSSTTSTPVSITNQNPPVSFAKQYPKQFYSFDSWGINVGIKYSFGKSSK